MQDWFALTVSCEVSIASLQATTLTEVLRAKHNIKLVSPGSSDSQHDSLQRFQMDFLERFLPSISSGLRGVFRNEIVLRAASTSKPVYDRFCRSQTQKQGNLCAVFHGTDQANLPSIYEKGRAAPYTNAMTRLGHSGHMLVPCIDRTSRSGRWQRCKCAQWRLTWQRHLHGKDAQPSTVIWILPWRNEADVGVWGARRRGRTRQTI